MIRFYKSGSVELCQDAFNVIVDLPPPKPVEEQKGADKLPTLDGQTEISDDMPIMLNPKEVEAIIAAAQIEAEQIVSKAYLQANAAREKIFQEAHAQAQAKAEEITRQAYMDGQARGYAEAAEAKVTQVEQLVGELEETVARIEGSQSGFIAEYESDLHWAALEICSKVLHRAVEQDELELLETVKSAVDEVRGAEWIDLHLAAQSVELIDRLRREFAPIKNLEIIPGDLPEGSCLVDTPALQLDASIDTQLENLREYFMLHNPAQ